MLSYVPLHLRDSENKATEVKRVISKKKGTCAVL